MYDCLEDDGRRFDSVVIPFGRLLLRVEIEYKILSVYVDGRQVDEPYFVDIAEVSDDESGVKYANISPRHLGDIEQLAREAWCDAC